MNVVFDFGAVLVTWRPLEIVAEVFPERAASKEQARQLASDLFGHEDWFDFDRGLVSVDAVVERSARRLSLDKDTVYALVSGIGERLQPMQETLAVLHALQERREAGDGVRGLYFLSNMPEPYARELEQKHAFLKHFDGGIFSGDVFLSKPDARIYEALQSRYALEPERTVFIDDLPANIEAAQALGWTGIHFTSAAQLADTLRKEHGL
jgi:putative hydrolase of the HAD superfamily